MPAISLEKCAFRKQKCEVFRTGGGNFLLFWRDFVRKAPIEFENAQARFGIRFAVTNRENDDAK